jgi:predicted MPP superfamily phosphohydrolase
MRQLVPPFRKLGMAAVTVVLLISPSRVRSQAESSDEAPAAAPATSSLAQLEQQYRAEADDKRRAALVAKMIDRPGAEEVLLRILRTDRSDDVAFVAGNAWRRIVLGGAVNGLQGRFDATSDSARRSRLAREIERYQVFAAGQNVPRFLREAPPAFDVKVRSHRHVRVLAFGDFGDHSSRQERLSQAMLRYHAEKRFDFAVTLGDNFYPAGIASPTDERWQHEFERLYGPLRIPFFATLGNHDWVLADSPAAEILRSAKSETWRMPADRYSFVAGPVQFFALDTNLLTRAQLDWLDAELGRSTARWKVVYGHHPILAEGVYGDNQTVGDKLMPILRGRANLYLCGHEHDLEHIVGDGGVHLVIAGSGGASPYPMKASPRAAFAAAQNGFAVIEADRRVLSVSLVDGDLNVLHRFAITTPLAAEAPR